MDERFVLFGEGRQRFKSKTDNGAVMELKGNVAGPFGLVQNIGGVQVVCDVDVGAVHIMVVKLETRSSQDIGKPRLGRVGIGAGADEPSFPAEKEHASFGVVFPRQHSQGGV